MLGKEFTQGGKQNISSQICTHPHPVSMNEHTFIAK